jgi:hypothetical protein
MEETLKLKIIGEGGQLTKTLGDLQSQLRRFQDGLKSAGNTESFSRIQRSIDATKQRIEALNKTSAGVQKVTKDFTGFSRVIQDLPFGFVAISNNLEQLIPAAGGAGLAFSGLISVLTFASIGFNNWTRGLGLGNESLEDQVKKLNDAKQALANYTELLNDRAKIQVVGTQNAQEEIVRLQTLYKATQDSNIPLAKRKELVDQLQEQYPKYFKNISDETILAGGAEKAYQRLALSILAASKARAGQDLLVDVQKQDLAIAEQQLDQNQKEYDAVQNLTKATQSLNAERSASRSSSQDAQRLTGQNQINQLRDKEISAEKNLNEIRKKGADLQKQRLDLQQRAARITGEITSIVEQNPDALLDPTGGGTKTPKTIKVPVRVRLSVINIDDELTIDNFFKVGAESLSRDVDKNLTKLIETHLATQPIKPHVNITPDVALITPDDALLGAQILAFTQQINTMLTAAGGEMAVAFGQTLGDIFSGKGLTSAFSNIANVLGGFIQDLGKLLIKNAIEVQLFKKALAGLIANPALALAVGIGLVAVGAIIKNSVPSVPKFERGGLLTGATLGLVGEGIGTSAANPEVVAPSIN